MNWDWPFNDYLLLFGPFALAAYALIVVGNYRVLRSWRRGSPYCFKWTLGDRILAIALSLPGPATLVVLGWVYVVTNLDTEVDW